MINISLLFLDDAKRIIIIDKFNEYYSNYFNTVTKIFQEKYKLCEVNFVLCNDIISFCSFEQNNLACVCTLYDLNITFNDNVILDYFDYGYFYKTLFETTKNINVEKKTEHIKNNNDKIIITIEEFHIKNDNTCDLNNCDTLPILFGEQGYLNLLSYVLNNDTVGRQTRNAKTFSVFGPQLEFDMSKGFPLLTSKRINLKNIFGELIMFLRGETNVKMLNDANNTIWNKNTSREFLDSLGFFDYPVFEMGPMYGYVWRYFGKKYKIDHDLSDDDEYFDQLHDLIRTLLHDPHSRRMLMTSFHPSSVKKCVLAPCHGIAVQLFVRQEKYLDMKMYQRSADLFLGLPYNIASYGLLMHLLCHISGYVPGKLLLTLGDAHIYESHIDAVKTQLERLPKSFPNLIIKKNYDLASTTEEKAIDFLTNLSYDDIELVDYNPHGFIKAEMVA